jgi:PAS domain S-box-containing protein
MKFASLLIDMNFIGQAEARRTQSLLIQGVIFMSLKLKVMLILLCVFGLYGVMNFWVQRYVIFPGFLSLERDEAIKNVKRIEEAFKNEIHRLDSICWDWSAWNDSYQFMESRSAEYIETNLIPGTFTVNSINTIYYINTKEKIIWSKTYDPKYNKIIQLTDFPKDTFPPNHPLISYLSTNIPVTKMGVAGIYMTQNGPMFISSRPITKSNDEGPPRGSLIFGRFLNDEFIKTLEDQTKINFQAFPVHAGSLPTPLKDIPNRITDESRYLVDSSANDSIYAYTTLPDIIGNAAILIKSQTPKKISEQGYVTVSYAMYLILAIGIGVLIVMSLLLHYSVLGPITDLKDNVMLIRKTGDISASLSSQRRDEIGILAIEFDRMLEQLRRFQTKLEVKVKERTSELAISNKNLQQEIEERKQAEEALRESEELFSKFSEATWEAIIIHDRGILLQANGQYYQMFGYERAELPGKQAIFMTTTPESLETIMKNINSNEAGPYEVTGIRKDGTEFPMEIRGKMMKYSGKKVRVAAIRDITERKQAENELQKRKTELKIQSQHLHEVNSALKVLLKQRDEDKKELQESIVANVKELVAPYLAKLSQSKLDERQKSYINLAQANLDDIISPFIGNLSSKFLKLTPTEIQVANLIKHGKITKDIAEILYLSVETVKFHRKNIRKKIGINSKKANLRTYLLSIQ